MATLQKTGTMLVFFILLGGVSGGILSEILRRMSTAPFVHDIFLKGFKVGITPPMTVDLHLVSFTLGFSIQVNLLILLGVILGIYTYKQA
ncbi:MAG: DUF4321 domain-containing protein [Nitrospiria bacterium]